MTKYGCSRRLATALTPLLFLVPVDAAQAKPDYLKRYEAGLKAIEREDWDRASELMQEALMERADEARRLSQWFHWQPYLPHYYYGLARFRDGDCPQALRSFNASEEQGVLLGQEDLYSEMLRLREACEAKGEKEAVAGPGDDQEKRVRVADLAESGTKILDAAQPLARSEKDQRRFQDARTGLGVVKTTDEEAERISELADGSAPPALDRAVSAYFGGEPAQVLAILSGFSDEDPKAMAHVHLLRAAAAHRLWLRSAETDAGLLARARQAAGAFKASGAGVAPPRSLFGPRFLRFLASAPTEPAPE